MPAEEWRLSYRFKHTIETHATNSVVSQSLVCWLHERNEGYVGYMRGTRDMLVT